MNKPDCYDELIGLLSRLADDGELDAAGRTQLEDILAADRGARMIYMQFVDLQLELACMADESSAELPRPTTSATSANRRGGGRRLWLAAAATAIAAFGLFLVLRPAPDRIVAKLDHIQGDVLIIPKKGLPWSPDNIVDVRSSYTIRVRGGASSAVLVYPDQTLVALVGDTELSFSPGDQKDLSMTSGVLAASVSKQPPGKPMRISTPKANIEVLGTEFTLEASAIQTHLAVLEGAVEFIRNADSERVQVEQGEVASAVEPPKSTEAEDLPQPELVAEPPPPPPDDWSVDFEDGIPPGWSKAVHETDDLPPGSRGAARAGRSSDGEKVYHQIQAPSSWTIGQFNIGPDSHLHLTFKMENPNWINLFVSARSPELKDATWTLYKNVDIPFWPPKPGVWQTVTIPFAKFLPVAGEDQSPIIGKIPYGILISSTSDDRGLVIDKIWVTQHGPGKVEVVEH